MQTCGQSTSQCGRPPSPGWKRASLAEARGDRGIVVAFPRAWAQEAELHQLGGLDWGQGEKIPEPGKADALLEEGRGTPVSLERSVSATPRRGPLVSAKESPGPSQTSVHGLHHPTLPCRVLLTRGQAEQR